ncbi:hypothetical protein TRVL_03819 [Trypanosoma vivax]|nr:hypothetical protein TRVL_03819 [Trypanosoma vivax]
MRRNKSGLDAIQTSSCWVGTPVAASNSDAERMSVESNSPVMQVPVVLHFPITRRALGRSEMIGETKREACFLLLMCRAPYIDVGIGQQLTTRRPNMVTTRFRNLP